MELVFATGNKGKLREASEILGPSFTLRSPADVGVFEDVEETGATMRENAAIKARHLWRLTGKNCFADDSGLEVDALGGAPGVYSARYAGEDKDFARNIDKVLEDLAAAEDKKDMRARFRCVIALIYEGREYYFDGVLEGRITPVPAGCGGFGYDPIFIPEGYDKTLAQMEEEEKNSISHRYHGLVQMRDMLMR